MWQVADQSWELALEHVLEQRLLHAVFQPIIDLSRGVVCGYEGLARVDLDSLDAGPEAWFAAAAWHGYTGRLEAMALEAMLAQRATLPVNCFLAVNLSPAALITPEVVRILAAPEHLHGVVLEITEQTPVEDYDTLLAEITRLRGRGAVVAVDDTGAGYSSIAHLLAVRPEFVKLDRSLIHGIDHDQRRAAAVAALGAFAGELDAWIIAEGVETQSELDRLIDLGVPLVQGFHVGRPDPTMHHLPRGTARHMRRRAKRLRANRLAALAKPAPTVTVEPSVVAEATVLVDAAQRPLAVLEPAGGRRIARHPAMCVQTGDDVPDVALRATGRPSEDRYAPICLCDELGRFAGLIHPHSLLESLARTPPPHAR